MSRPRSPRNRPGPCTRSTRCSRLPNASTTATRPDSTTRNASSGAPSATRTSPRSAWPALAERVQRADPRLVEPGEGADEVRGLLLGHGGEQPLEVRRGRLGRLCHAKLSST